MNNVQQEAIVLTGVLDAGIPNQERIALRCDSPADTSSYALVLCRIEINGTAVPLLDNFLWLGKGLLNPGDWIFIYTAPGYYRSEPIIGTPNTLHSLHWGKRETIFQTQEIRPSLIGFGSIQTLMAHPFLGSQAQGSDRRIN